MTGGGAFVTSLGKRTPLLVYVTDESKLKAHMFLF